MVLTKSQLGAELPAIDLEATLRPLAFYFAIRTFATPNFAYRNLTALHSDQVAACHVKRLVCKSVNLQSARCSLNRHNVDILIEKSLDNCPQATAWLAVRFVAYENKFPENFSKCPKKWSRLVIASVKVMFK